MSSFFFKLNLLSINSDSVCGFSGGGTRMGVGEKVCTSGGILELLENQHI